MNDRCSACDEKFEREPGQWLGAIYINLGLTISLALAGFLLTDSLTPLSTTEQLIIWLPVAALGPFAHLRPGAAIGESAKIGNFVELKNTSFGPRSKANHLSYLGDATIGADVNVGAGTITCNYDGAHKHRTVIEDGAFIGSDSQLVAPVTVGKGAYVGAGSSIVDDVPAGALGIARGRQSNVEGWAARRKDSTGKT